MPAFKKTGVIARFLAAFSVGIIFVILSYTAGISALAVVTAPLTSVGGLATFLAAIVLVIDVHEAGHLIVGLLAGLKLQSMRAWPFVVSVEPAGFRVRLSLVPAQNATYMLANDFEDFGFRMALFAVSGSFANLACFVFSYLVFVHYYALADPDAPVGCFAYWFALLSLMIGVTNLFVHRHQPLQSDGAAFCDALTDSPHFRRSIALQKLGLAMRGGTPAGALDRELIEEAVALHDGSRIEMLANMLAYSASAAQSADRAAAFLERALETTQFAVPADRINLAVESCVFAATHRRDVALAMQWLENVDITKRSPPVRLRVEAALDYARGDAASAIAKVEALMADPSVQKLPTREAFRSACQVWIEEMRAAL